MGVTNFPNGVFASPMIGAGRLSDIFASGNIYFVNADASRTGNGKSPDRALTSITAALSAMSKDGTIYVKPRTTTASAQTYYQEDLVIPLTKPNISIIGCGATYGNPSNLTGVQLKPLTVAGHLITVNGAGLNLENLRLTMTGGTALADKCAVFGGVQSTSIQPQGLTIRGCIFENCDKSHAATNVAAVAVDTSQYVFIEDNFFINCLGGVGVSSITGHAGRTVIRRNIFSGGAEKRDCDIIASLGDAANGMGFIVDWNIFADILPAHSGGTTGRWIKITGAGGGMISNNMFASTAATGANQWGPTGTQTIIPDTTFFVNNFAADLNGIAAQT